MKKLIGTLLVAFSILFGYNADNAAKALACKTITVDAYYTKYGKIKGNNWWTYVQNDGSLVIAHQEGTTVKDLGKSFFLIGDKFNGIPTFSYVNGKMEIKFPSLKDFLKEASLPYFSTLSKKSLTVDAYYTKYDKINGNNWWTYVQNDGSLIIAHQEGTTVKDLGKSFFLIGDKFNGIPTFSYVNGKIEIKFPPLKGGTCKNNNSITPPTPKSDDTNNTFFPPQTPNIQ